MTVINTNAASLVTQAALSKNTSSLQKTMEQLSTGKRINSAADDAAGLAISSKMTAAIQGLTQAVRNANDGISLVQTAEGSTQEITNMLQRMRELAVQSMNDTYSSIDRNSMDTEYQQLMFEMARIANTTKWSNFSILNGQGPNGLGSEFQFKVGSDNSQNAMDFVATGNDVPDGSTTILSVDGTGTLTSGNVYTLTVPLTGQETPLKIDVAVPFDTNDFAQKIADAIELAANSQGIESGYPTSVTFSSGTLELSYDDAPAATSGAFKCESAPNSVISISFENFDPLSPGSVTSAIGGSNLKSSSAANSALSAIDEAIDAVNTERSNMGAKINRLQFSVNNSTNIVTHLSESRSRIEDVDYAKATSELARRQIIQQAATAMLAQANQSPQTVLQLLKGG